MLKRNRITYTFRLNERLHAFELMHENECVGFVNFELKEGVYVLSNTEIKPEYELKEASTHLAEMVFTYLQENQIKSVIYSRTLLSFIRRNKKWHYLISDE